MATALELVRNAFDGTAKGDGRAFVDMMAEDVEWSIIGTTEWSRTFVGKASVLRDLLGPLARQFDGPNIVEATRFVADGNIIAVEAVNRSTTKSGAAYPNRYCWVFEVRDSKVVGITEYCDTALVERTLKL